MTGKQLRAQELARQSDAPIVVMRDGAPAEELVDAAVEAQWAAEVRRRIAKLDAGAPTLPWEEARKRIAPA